MARGASRLDDVFSLARAGGRRSGAELDACDRLEARGHRFGRERAGIGVGLAQHQLHQQQDAGDRHDERKQDHDDELLRRLDERRVLIVRAHGMFWFWYRVRN